LYDGTYLSVLSNGDGIYGRYFEVCDYTVSPCSYACDYSIGISNEPVDRIIVMVIFWRKHRSILQISKGYSTAMEGGQAIMLLKMTIAMASIILAI
jgi:hypothetical protein